jgi:hypothetical protein
MKQNVCCAVKCTKSCHLKTFLLKSNYRSGVTTDNAFEGIFGSLICKVGGLWSAEHLPRIEHSSR